MTTETHRDFVIESREHLSVFEQSLLALEKIHDQRQLREHIDRSLRAIHSLKGDAGFLGFTTLRSVAHSMEGLLEIYRTGGDLPPAPVVETLLAARDCLAALVEDLEHSQSTDVSALLARLSEAETYGMEPSSRPLDLDLVSIAQALGGSLAEFFASLGAAGRVASPRVLIDCDLTAALPRGAVRLQADFFQTHPDHSLEELIHAGSSQPNTPAETCYSISIDLCEWTAGTEQPLIQLCEELASRGRLVNPQIELEPSNLIEQLPGGPIFLRGEFQSRLSREELEQALGIPGRPNDRGRPSGTGGQSRAVRTDASPAPPDRGAGPEASPKSPERQGTVETERLTSLRVNVDLLDRMMTLVGELTLVRNQSLLAFAEEDGAPRAIIQRLNAVTSELQEAVLRTRMQPVGNLFGKFPRMVRDLARQLGKQVEIVTVGREVELDKTVLEQLSDPLTHLIRNSIDHGIELPEERQRGGKSPVGTITLSATPADGQVLIEIRDDGRGIDPAAIRAKALAQRLKPPDELERMSQRELFSLILLPGFSTARQVTDVSGRGVGMDVVKTNVEQLEGSLTIDSVPGEGTSMLLRVPLTLAIIPCLIVEVGEERFAVPQRDLEEIVCLHPGGKGSIEQAYDAEIFRLRNRLLPIVRYQEVLERRQPFDARFKAEVLARHRPETRDPDRIEYILVLRSRDRRFGLLVDRVRGTQEVVVKPMHPAMKRLGIYSGATLMGDGRAALIANVDGIAEHANCFSSTMRPLVEDQAVGPRNPHEVHRVLIFESGPLEQFALPLVQIRRLELLDMRRVETIGDLEFATINGVATRIVRLDQVLKVSPVPPREQMYLILPKFVPEPMGILVSRIVDTESLAIELQQSTVTKPGVLGTAIIRDRLSLFLDVQQVREAVFGKHAAGGEDPGATSPGGLAPAGRRVLLIDDTPFFREIVRRYLEAEGIEVDTAVDGLDGLDKLASQQFDLAVCDIEMPNLDGWGFVQAARERGVTIPLLALTSLSKAEHESRAIASGFNEFQEKLDHDRLVRTVHRLLGRSAAGQLEETRR